LTVLPAVTLLLEHAVMSRESRSTAGHLIPPARQACLLSSRHHLTSASRTSTWRRWLPS